MRRLAEAAARPTTPAVRPEHDAFDEDLLNEAAAGCAQRAADGDLALAGRGAGEHQVGHVGAGDEQNEANRAEEKQQAGTHGAGFGFEQRNDGHVGGPSVGHLPWELMHQDAAKAAQLSLRLAGSDAVGKTAEDMKSEDIPGIVWSRRGCRKLG